MDYTKDALLIQDLADEKARDKLLDGTNSSVAGNILETLIEYLNKTNVTDLANGGFGNESDGGYVPYDERPETYIVPFLFAVIFIIGILGNGILIVIFLKDRKMRNVPNMYICSLAVGDILVIFFCVPFTSTVYTVESWPYGLMVCKFSAFITDVSIGVSVFTLTALSADRYCAIVDPMRKLPGRRATRITCITIAGIWIISLVIALPSVLFSYIREVDVNDGVILICYPYPPELGSNYPRAIVIFKFLVYYAVPLVFIATFYIIMARHLVLSTRNMPGEAQGQAKQIQGRKKVAKMVLSFVVIFAICFFPNHLFFLWFYFDPNAEENFNQQWNAIRILGFCLSFINSCINPITLYILSKTFRKHFNKHLFCCICDGEERTRGAGGGGTCNQCAVSMSNSNHHQFGGSERNNRNGVGGGGAALCRHHNQSMMSTAGGLNKRKCNWESPSSASHHQLFSMSTLNTPGGVEVGMVGGIGVGDLNNSANSGIIMTTRLDGGGYPTSTNNLTTSNSTSPRTQVLRGPSGRLNSPPMVVVDTEFTMTSFVQNADSRSLESLK